MDSTNYTNFQIGFQLGKNDMCLNKKTLKPEKCKNSYIFTDSDFERVTFGDNTYALVDSTYTNCLTNDNTMRDFNYGNCKVFQNKQDQININGYKIRRPTYNSTYITNIGLDKGLEYTNAYIPDKIIAYPKQEIFAPIPTLPVGFNLPFNGNTLYKK
jgi:hypothetical protein